MGSIKKVRLETLDNRASEEGVEGSNPPLATLLFSKEVAKSLILAASFDILTV